MMFLLEDKSSLFDLSFSSVNYSRFILSFILFLSTAILGQLELLQQGWPFVMFGDGTMCKCNPIAEYVLSHYLIYFASLCSSISF